MYSRSKNCYLSSLFLSMLLVSYILSDKNPIKFLGLFFLLLLLMFVGNKIFNGLYTTWIGPWLGLNVNPKSLGRWAVITGATDGIGLEYCRQLGGLGMNICLISRSQNKLEEIAGKLEKQFNIKTHTIAVDFSLPPDVYFKSLKKDLEKINAIGILVNNVGICYESPAPFTSPDLSVEFIMSLMNVSIHAALMMTKIILPEMVLNNKGAVINVGSMSFLFGLPLFSLYSSTKSFMERFTTDLKKEYVSTNIMFQFQYPGYITTKMNRFKKQSIFLPSPKSYVACALRSIGLQGHSAIWPWHRVVVPIVCGYKFLMPNLADELITGYSRVFWGTFRKKFDQIRAESGTDAVTKGTGDLS